MDNTSENKANFFLMCYANNRESIKSRQGKGVVFSVISIVNDPDSYYSQLASLSEITDEDAFEVARIMHGDSDKFAIEFNANGLTSVSPYGLPCYSDTVDINWGGEISYERGSQIDALHAYQYLQSKGYALPYMGLSVEQLVEYGWIKLTTIDEQV